MIRFDFEDVATENWLKDFVEEVYAPGHELKDAVAEFATTFAQEHALEALKSDEEYNFVGGQMLAVEHGEGHESTPEESINEIADLLRTDAWQHVVDLYAGQSSGQMGYSAWALPTLDVQSPSGKPFAVEHDDVDVAYVGPPSGKGPLGGGGGSGSSDAETPVLSYTSGNVAVGQMDNSEFNIQIDFFGAENEWSDFYHYFVDAADYLSSVITGDVEFATLSGGEWIDDIKIDARLGDIDGENGVLGQTGITSYRAGDVLDPNEEYLPATAFMEFDIADVQSMVASDTFAAVVLHEMTHALGFGGMWEAKGLVSTVVDDNDTRSPKDDISTPYFNGVEANKALDAANGAGGAYEGIESIWIETDGGSGTAGYHWDEDAFGEILMTGYLTTTNASLSDITIASLEDMGYETTWDSGMVA